MSCVKSDTQSQKPTIDHVHHFDSQKKNMTSKVCMSINNLNNKGRMQGYISSMSVCLCVCPRWISETAAPTNIKFGQLTHVMILTKMKYYFFMYTDYFWNKLQFTKYQTFLYISKTVNRTNAKFRHSIANQVILLHVEFHYVPTIG